MSLDSKKEVVGHSGEAEKDYQWVWVGSQVETFDLHFVLDTLFLPWLVFFGYIKDLGCHLIHLPNLLLRLILLDNLILGHD